MIRTALLPGILFLLAGCTCSFCQFATADWEEADRDVVRLSPSNFPQLPKAIRQELARRNCTIPQVSGEKKPGNVVQGRFIQRDELDWAVLCSVNRSSSILVFRNASPAVFAELTRGADINLLQGDGDHKIGYSRGLAAVGREIIISEYRAFGGVKPPPIDHQGIEDAFVDKASTILYFFRGKWLILTGSD